MVCTFFGHADAPKTIEMPLREVLINLIENYGVSEFYVGNNGRFDFMVHKQLKELSNEYNISYSIVLAYLNNNKQDVSGNTIFPEGIEAVPKRFAISWRNKWMLNRADIVVTYVTHNFGGAAQFSNMAKRQGKKIIEVEKDNITKNFMN